MLLADSRFFRYLKMLLTVLSTDTAAAPASPTGATNVPAGRAAQQEGTPQQRRLRGSAWGQSEDSDNTELTGEAAEVAWRRVKVEMWKLLQYLLDVSRNASGGEENEGRDTFTVHRRLLVKLDLSNSMPLQKQLAREYVSYVEKFFGNTAEAGAGSVLPTRLDGPQLDALQPGHALFKV